MSKPNTFPTIRALDKFTEDIGVSATTMWKWRKWGYIKTHNLHGKQFVTAEEAGRFVRRLEAGEFAKHKQVPPPPKSRSNKPKYAFLSRSNKPKTQ
jgi:hypothetical protein